MYWPLVIASFGLGVIAGTIDKVYPAYAYIDVLFAYAAGVTMVLGTRLKLPDDFPIRRQPQ